MTNTPDAPLPPAAPSHPAPAFALDPAQWPGVATALGVSLVTATVSTSMVYSRIHGELDRSNFSMGVVASVGLLVVAVYAYLRAPESEAHATLVSWPGAAGAISAGVMVAVLVDDDPAAVYLGAGVAAVIAAGGFVVTRGAAPFVLAGFGALAVLYAQAFSDVVALGEGGDNTFMVVGAGVFVFVLAITAVGWLLPATRVLTGVIAGGGGLYAMFMILGILSVSRHFVGLAEQTASSADDLSPLPAGASFGQGGDPYQNDVYVILLLCALLVALWVACALATGHIGFRILVVAAAVTIVPTASFALLAQHPTWWEVGSGVLGGALLLWTGYRQLVRPVRPVEAPQ